MKLYIIRHGENQANIDHHFSYKIVDYSLNERGAQQARYLAEWLADCQIARVYSSPLKRAYETAQIIAERVGSPEVEVLENLREVNVGVLEGHNSAANWELHDEIIRRWINGEAEVSFEGGENLLELQARARQAIEQILTENAELGPEQGVAVVAHGGLIVFGFPPLFGNLTPGQYRPGLHNTATTVVEVNETQLNCLEWGLMEHLPADMYGSW